MDDQLPEGGVTYLLMGCRICESVLGGNSITITALEQMVASRPKKKQWNVVGGMVTEVPADY
jgi:hypothetical protein